MHWVSYLHDMLPGLVVTVKLTIYSTILGTIISFAFGLGKLSHHWFIKAPSATVVEIFRGTSLLVQMFWLYYALPIIGQMMGLDVRIPPIIAGVIALSLNIGAYGAEVVRGAVQAVSRDQYEAALALNFTPRQTLWKIALPQALPEMMPPFGNLAIQNLKDTSLVSLITIADLAFMAKKLRTNTADSTTIYTTELFIYFILSLILSFLIAQLAKRIGTGARLAGRRGTSMLYGIHWDLSSTLDFAISILPILLIAGITTVKATVIGFFLAMTLGLVLAGLRSVPFKIVRWPASFVLEFLRGTPLLIQLFFVFYVLPQITGWTIPEFIAGVVALGLQYSAYCAEVYRAGIEAVPEGQREASRALNLSPLHTFVFIIVPQAVPRIIPALGNYAVSIIKDSPILSAITVLEMLSVATIIGDRTYDYMVPLTIVGIMFLILTVIVATVIRIIDTLLPKRGIPLK